MPETATLYYIYIGRSMQKMDLNTNIRSIALKWVIRSIVSGRFSSKHLFKVMSERCVDISMVGVHEADLCRWTEYGTWLIPSSFQNRSAFTLSEAAWLRFVQEVERNRIPLTELDGMLGPLVLSEQTLKHIVNSPLFKKALLLLFPKDKHSSVSGQMAHVGQVQEKLLGRLPSVSIFDALIYAYTDFGVRCSLFRNVHRQWALVSHDLLQVGSLDSSSMSAVSDQHGVSFSISGLLAGLVNPDTSAHPQVVALSKNEKTLMDILRDEANLKRLSIRFDNEGEMSLLEMTRSQIFESLQQIDMLIKGGSYHDVSIEMGDGQVFKFHNTKKVKLK